MRWYFTAALAIFAAAILCRGIADSKSAKSLGIQKSEEKKETAVLKEVHLSAGEEKATSADEQKHLPQNSEHLAASKHGAAAPDAVENRNEHRAEDARRSRSRNRNRNRRRKNNYRSSSRRRHTRYRSYRTKFHDQRNYNYLKKIIDPDSDMVQDIATVDDIIALEAADNVWPKKKKRNTKDQDDDDSCSNDDD